ncbi:unnamed protein product [Pleuronectes platessa]|uniref:Uncharacterized protein n=1 Tax=Pleuronectes platessa TaxID=8262 RepID=A0A9N7W411_PLEPL|nr:unnamed protein product [Pleuronectes platessa]
MEHVILPGHRRGRYLSLLHHRRAQQTSPPIQMFLRAQHRKPLKSKSISGALWKVGGGDQPPWKACGGAHCQGRETHYAARTKYKSTAGLLETRVFINMGTGWKRFPDLERFKCKTVEGPDKEERQENIKTDSIAVCQFFLERRARRLHGGHSFSDIAFNFIFWTELWWDTAKHQLHSGRADRLVTASTINLQHDMCCAGICGLRTRPVLLSSSKSRSWYFCPSLFSFSFSFSFSFTFSFSFSFLLLLLHFSFSFLLLLLHFSFSFSFFSFSFSFSFKERCYNDTFRTGVAARGRN